MDLLTGACPRLATLLIGVALGGCSARSEEARRPDTTPERTERAEEGRPSSSEATAVGAPGVRTPSREDAGAGTPRREASERLVEKGRGYRIAGRDDEARARFQEALRVDGSNGAAYYHLAVLAADAREWADAEGYLAQAEALLRGRADYRGPLSDLAERIAARR